MTRTFGRRQPPDTLRVEAAPPPPPPAPPERADPRIEALVASVREADPGRDELRDYLSARRRAIGPWRWLARGLFFAPAGASWLLGVHGLWLAPISLASFCGPMLVKRARLRWAAQLEPKPRTTFEA